MLHNKCKDGYDDLKPQLMLAPNYLPGLALSRIARVEGCRTATGRSCARTPSTRKWRLSSWAVSRFGWRTG